MIHLFADNLDKLGVPLEFYVGHALDAVHVVDDVHIVGGDNLCAICPVCLIAVIFFGIV